MSPILWALGYPERLEEPPAEPGFDPLRDGPLEFEEVRRDAFPLFAAGVDAGRRGGELPVAFNAANEIAVAAFLQHRIGFGELSEVVVRTVERFDPVDPPDAERIWQIDDEARMTAEGIVREISTSSSTGGREQITISGEG